MLRTPSGRRERRRRGEKLNLVPMLDSVFIFIFFLLMSASFLNLFEISSDVPIVSNTPPPKKTKPPLALTVIIERDSILVATGVPSSVRKKFNKNVRGDYDLAAFKNYLVLLKKRYKKEDMAILEPRINLKYETLIKIMDTIRTMENVDEDIFYIDKQGVSRKLENLFSKIIFGNIFS